MEEAQQSLRRCEMRIPVRDKSIVIDVGGPGHLTGALNDISMHGACIEGPTGVRLPAFFKVKTGTRWRTVEVQWRSKTRLGIKFV